MLRSNTVTKEEVLPAGPRSPDRRERSHDCYDPPEDTECPHLLIDQIPEDRYRDFRSVMNGETLPVSGPDSVAAEPVVSDGNVLTGI